MLNGTKPTFQVQWYELTDLVSITSALLLAFIGGEIALRLHFPRVIGQLVISLLLGIPLLRETLFTEQSIHIISVFSDLGIIFLMLLTGFELDLASFNRNKMESFLIAFFGAVIPFLFGYTLGIVMGLPTLTGMILGMSLAITAEGVTAAMLLEMGKIKTRIASILLGAGIIDDIMGIVFLSGVLIFISGKTSDLMFLPLKMIALCIVSLLAFLSVPKLMRMIEKDGGDILPFSAVLIVGLILAILSQLAGLSTILGAFIAGIILQQSFANEKNKLKEERHLQMFLLSFILPFFFIYIGLQFDYRGIIENPLMKIGIRVLGMGGKFLGTLIAVQFLNLRNKQLLLIGWGMNSR